MSKITFVIMVLGAMLVGVFYGISIAHADHALALIQTDGGGVPKIDIRVTPYSGHVFIGAAAGWGAYLISGTLAQLQALNALPGVVGICLMTTGKDGEAGAVKWAQLDNVITPALRTKLNTYLTSKGLTTIPAAWSNRQVVMAAFKRLNPDFDLDKEWVTDQTN